jgi:2-enoate reductase
MKLFQPKNIGKLTIKNRIVMAPMAIGGLVEPDGRFSEQAIAYYRERARGGTGLIISGLSTVDSIIEANLLNGWSAFPRLDSGAYVPRLSKLADAIHDYGAKIAVQVTAGFERVAPRFLLRGRQPIAPSALPCFWDSRVSTRELTLEEIEKLIKSFASAARVCQAAGIDPIELHGHEGYLLDQFKTELWNKRRDKYGGDLSGRLRFSQEVIQAIKKAAGEDFPLIYRFGLTHYLDGGRTIDEGLEIARRLESFGVDALHVDAGSYETWHWAHPPLYMERRLYG